MNTNTSSTTPPEDPDPQGQLQAPVSDTSEKPPAQKLIEAFRDAAHPITPPDTSPLPTTPPEDPNSRSWLSSIAHEALQSDCAQSFIEEVRDKAGLLDPLDSRELDDNRRVPRHKVARIVRELAPEYDWPDDFDIVNYGFRTELLKSDLEAHLAPQCEELTPEDELFAASMSEAIYLFWVRGGFERLFADIFTNVFTEYAISGNIAPITALPSWFSGCVFQIPFMETSFVISISTPFSNIKEQVRLLKSQCRSAYAVGQRRRQRKYPERDRWVYRQYQQIKESEDIPDANARNELLSRFGESEWGQELARYGISKPEGKRKAINFLNQIIYRERKYLRDTLDLLPPSSSNA